MDSIYEKLTVYERSDAYPMHMPGHKRNTEKFHMKNPYGLDITEIHDFDDLHEPEGILRESMDLAAQVYGAEESWYLINGSTAGILAGIHACVHRGDRILIARNCHKAVYHGIVLNQLHPTYLHPYMNPETGIPAGIEPVEVEQALQAAEDEGRPLSLVVITSPTYEGILSDVQMIGDICHRHGVPLMVDEAHGAHLRAGQMKGNDFPLSALGCGADLVVQSLHKTLGAFTQTAILHGQGELVDRHRVKRALDIYQTSSPSYILMAGIDGCIRRLAHYEGEQDFRQWTRRLHDFYMRIGNLKCLEVVTDSSDEHFFRWDPTRIVVSTARSNHSGPELMNLLRDTYGLELEMASKKYVIAMTGQGDTDAGMERLASALLAIDRIWAAEEPSVESKDTFPLLPRTEILRALPWEAEEMRGEKTKLGRESLGRISLEFVYAYPPGIPILVPGEEVTEEVLAVIEGYKAVGITMRGYQDQANQCLRTVGETR